MRCTWNILQRILRRQSSLGIVTSAESENYCATGDVGGLDPSFSALTRINSSGGFWSILRMTREPRPHVPHNSLVLVGDGQKALFLRNRGNALDVDLVVERILEQDNPPTREQGTDRPGRSTASLGVARSAMEEVDWHHLAKERF